MEKHVLFTELRSTKLACKPLSHLFIDGFIFMRLYQDGSFVDLSNQIEWSEDFLTRYLNGEIDQKHAKDHMLISPGVSLWSQNTSNSIWKEGRENWGFYSGISIAKEGPSWTDIFCFYSRQLPAVMDNLYLKNFQYLEYFCQNFLVNFADIIRKGKQNPLITPKVYLSGQDVLSNELKSFLKTFENDFVEELSIREKESIYYIARGNTAEEVSKILNVSRRTVESHLQNAKQKLNISKSSDLVKLYHRQGFFFSS